MYFVIRCLLDQSGKESHSLQRFASREAALKRFYTVLGADIDSAELRYELVQIVDERGLTLASQVFDRRGES